MNTFTYLGSTVTGSTSLDAEINSRIAKAAGVMAKLNKRVWNNSLLSERTKVCIYQACVLSTLLYGSESWSTYGRQECHLNRFHLCSLRCLLCIKWQEQVPNTEVLHHADLFSIPSLLIQRCLHWLGHVHHMVPQRLPHEILYGELCDGTCRAGRPLLCFKDTIRHDLKAANINVTTWEDIAVDRDTWRYSVKAGASRVEKDGGVQAILKRAARKQRMVSVCAPSTYLCANCMRDCHSRTGLHSHARSCPAHPVC